MLTKKDKKDIIEIFKSIDVSKMSIEHPDSQVEKWFRFGNYNGLKIASDIIKQLPEQKRKKKAQVS